MKAEANKSGLMGLDKTLIWIIAAALLSATVFFALSMAKPGHSVSAKSTATDGLLRIVPPEVGSFVSLPKVDLSGQPLEPADKMFVVSLGDCEDCALHRIDLSLIPQDSAIPIVFAISSGKVDWEKKMADAGLSGQIVEFEDISKVPDAMIVNTPCVVLIDQSHYVIKSGPLSLYPDKFIKETLEG
jgi:hypothetical protein